MKGVLCISGFITLYNIQAHFFFTGIRGSSIEHDVVYTCKHVSPTLAYHRFTILMHGSRLKVTVSVKLKGFVTLHSENWSASRGSSS